MLHQCGMAIGIGLLVLATGVAFAIISRAAKSVAQFRHEDHRMLVDHETRKARR